MKTWLVFNAPRKIKTGAGYLRRETITRSCLIKGSSFPALRFRGVSLCFRGSSFSLQPLHDNYIARVSVVNLTFLSHIMTKKVLQSIILSKTPTSLSDTFYLSRLSRLSKENVKTNRNCERCQGNFTQVLALCLFNLVSLNITNNKWQM